MSLMYCIDAFDSEAFEKEPVRSFETIEKHIIRGLTDNFNKEMKDSLTTEVAEGGWVDVILEELYIKTSDPEDEKIRESLLKLFSYLSETNGRLAKDFGLNVDNPLFFNGYLNTSEIKDLHSLLLNLPPDIEQGFLQEFKEQIIGMCDACEKKNLGLIYYINP